MRDHSLFFFVALLIVFWSVVSNLVRKAQRKTPSTSVWNQPAPRIFSRAADLDSLGLTSAIRAARQRSSNTDSSTSSSTEVHMNPISALVFIVFIGGAICKVLGFGL